MSVRSAWLALHAAVLLFGTAGLFARWLPVTPANLVFGRTLIAALALAVVWQWRGGGGRGTNAWLLLSGPLLALHWASFFAAIQASSVAIGLLGYASFPLFTLLFGLLCGERPRRSEMLAALAVSAGLVLLLPPGASLADRAVIGLGWGLLSGASFAALTLLNRRHAASTDPVLQALAQNALAALCLLPWISWPLVVGSAQWLSLLALGLVWTALSHTLFIAALRQVSAQQAALVASLEPAYGIVLAWALLGEAPSAREWAGAALIVGLTSWITTREARARAAAHNHGLPSATPKA